MEPRNTFAEDMLLLACGRYSPLGRAMTLEKMFEIVLQHHGKLLPEQTLAVVTFGQYTQFLIMEVVFHWFAKLSSTPPMMNRLTCAAYRAGIAENPKIFFEETMAAIKEYADVLLVDSIRPDEELAAKFVPNNVYQLR